MDQVMALDFVIKHCTGIYKNLNSDSLLEIILETKLNYYCIHICFLIYIYLFILIIYIFFYIYICLIMARAAF